MLDKSTDKKCLCHSDLLLFHALEAACFSLDLANTLSFVIGQWAEE